MGLYEIDLFRKASRQRGRGGRRPLAMADKAGLIGQAVTAICRDSPPRLPGATVAKRRAGAAVAPQRWPRRSSHQLRGVINVGNERRTPTLGAAARSELLSWSAPLAVAGPMCSVAAIIRTEPVNVGRSSVSTSPVALAGRSAFDGRARVTLPLREAKWALRSRPIDRQRPSAS